MTGAVLVIQTVILFWALWKVGKLKQQIKHLENVAWIQFKVSVVHRSAIERLRRGTEPEMVLRWHDKEIETTYLESCGSSKS